MILEFANNLNENLEIEKELIDDRRDQLDPNLMFMKNSGKNSVRDHCDGLHLEIIITFGLVNIILMSYIEKSLLGSRKRLGRHALTHPNETASSIIV